MTAGEGSAGAELRADGPASQAGAPRRRADPRLPGYLAAGFCALIAAVAMGRPELAALGAPFLALAAAGIAGREPPIPRGRVTLRVDRVIEGDVIEGEAVVEWDGPAEVDVMLTGWRGVEPVEAARVGRAFPAGRGPVRVRFRMRALSWGVHDLGSLWVRARRPGGLLVHERKVATAPALRVLPAPLRLDRLLRPAEPRAVAGMHLSRLRGHGTDFAELRPYQPGDRLRDVSWAASARLGEPWVTVHHPERTGTVLLLLDAFFSDERGSTEALARAARAAWAVASVHLRAQDRVGLLARGRTAAWVPPRGGRRGRWMLMDQLLAVGGAAEDVWRRRHRRGRVIVPADALIVGVTSLRSRTFARDLLHHRRAGHTVVALVIDTSDLLLRAPEGADGGRRADGADGTGRVDGADGALPADVPERAGGPEGAALRIWLARREAERRRLERGGVPTALVTAAGGVAPAISALRRRTATSRQSVRTGTTAS